MLTPETGGRAHFLLHSGQRFRQDGVLHVRSDGRYLTLQIVDPPYEVRYIRDLMKQIVLITEDREEP